MLQTAECSGDVATLCFEHGVVIGPKLPQGLGKVVTSPLQDISESSVSWQEGQNPIYFSLFPCKGH